MKVEGSKLKFIAKIAGFLAGFSVLGFLLIAISYTLPRGNITKHVSESSEAYASDSSWAPGLAATRNDHFSDAIILGIAAYRGENPIESAALTQYYAVPGQSPMDSLAYFYGGEGNTDQAETIDYARYWHGYLVFLAPLLEFFNPSELVFLNVIVQFALIIVLIVLAYRRYGAKLAVALAVFVFSLSPVTVALNFQYSAVFYPTILALLAIILWDKWLLEKNHYWYFFLLLGSATVFLDLLTYPLVSLGAPLALVFYLRRYQIKSARELLPPLRTGVLASVCWGIGYAGAWAFKWGISSLVLGRNMFSPALSQILYRSGNDFGHLETIRLNFITMFNLPMVFVLAVLAFAAITLILIKKAHFVCQKWSMLPYLILAAFPFIWYYAFANHSFVHHWFTYRELSIAVFAGTLVVANSITKRKEREKCPKKRKKSTKQRSI